MTPEQALAMLDNLAKNVSLSRPDHEKVQQAVAVLAQAIKPAVIKPVA